MKPVQRALDDAARSGQWRPFPPAAAISPNVAASCAAGRDGHSRGVLPAGLGCVVSARRDRLCRALRPGWLRRRSIAWPRGGESRRPGFQFRPPARRTAALGARTSSRSGHLFVGHTVCPGFSKIVASIPWWQDTRFCAPGYDYFGDGLDYTQVPVDMAPHAHARVDRGQARRRGLDQARRNAPSWSIPIRSSRPPATSTIAALIRRATATRWTADG